MPNTNIITVSQKIESEEERERLKKLVKENISEGNGAIIRTSAEEKDKEIIDDIKNIEAKWTKIVETSVKLKGNKPVLLHESEGIVEKILIDFSEKQVDKIIVNDKNECKKYEQIKLENKEYKNIKIELVENKEILDVYELNQQIEKALARKIWLRCGGFITIDKTEALTAIDVNTGKYTGTKNLGQTIMKVNKEATVEIAKQLRLRDIGGIVIIDYIDMLSQADRNEIEELLKQELKKDRSKTQVEGFTKLDLMEMTRKHICSHKE